VNQAAGTFDEVRDLYQAIILDHGRNPRHHRRLEVFDGHASGDNPMCGDRIAVWLRRDPAGRIADLGFEARGCAICVASGSLMSELCRGHDAAEVHALSDAARKLARQGHASASEPWLADALEKLAPLSGVADYPSRVKCATLAWHALEAALRPGDTQHGGKVSTE
jgi:nitrogen fixation protein NifU and related proteins